MNKNLALFERASNWNPQFYREIKGKLKWRNLIVTVLLSGLVQSLLLFSNSTEEGGVRVVNWLRVFQVLNWWLPIGAGAICIYLLSRDLCREKDSGTLDFIRYSPQPSESILLGKMLGVPILLYFALALALPLHVTAAILSVENVSVGEILLSLGSNYLVWIGLSSIFLNLSLLMVFMQAPVKGLNFLPAINTACWLIVSPFALVIISLFLPQLPSMGEGRGWNWFFLPERFAYFWLIGTLLAISFWIWQTVNRGFRNSHSSLIGKIQSYWIVGGTQIWLFGFALPDLILKQQNERAAWATVGLAISPIYVLLIASFLITPIKPDRLALQNIAEREVRKDLGLL